MENQFIIQKFWNANLALIDWLCYIEMLLWSIMNQVRDQVTGAGTW